MATDTLSLTFSALADPTRRAILARLAHGRGDRQGALGKPFAMSGPAVSKHLRVLERAGLIVRGREAQWRPCRSRRRRSRRSPSGPRRYRHFWDASYDRLDDYLQHLKQKEIDDDDSQ